MIHQRKPAKILRCLTRKQGELVVNLERGSALRALRREVAKRHVVMRINARLGRSKMFSIFREF